MSQQIEPKTLENQKVKTIYPFTLGLSKMFGPSFIDQHRSRAYIIDFFHSEIISPLKCPNCGHVFKKPGPRERFFAGKNVDCPNTDCRSRFNYRTGTPFHRSPMDAGEIVLMLWLIDNRFPVGDIAQILQRDKATVMKWRSRYLEEKEVLS